VDCDVAQHHKMTTGRLERLLVLLVVVRGPVARASLCEPLGGRETVISSVATNISGPCGHVCASA